MKADSEQGKTTPTLTERAIREKEWHNQAYSDSSWRAGKIKNGAILYKLIDKLDEYVMSELENSSKNVLDYGCGGGRFLIRNAERIANGVGIDISDVRIEKANKALAKKHIENLSFYVMDATKTIFPDDSFDVIRGQAILHHLDPEASLTEIKRILKPGGKAYFEEPLDTNPFISLYRKNTPQYRTIDEQPFGRKELALVKKYFPGMDAEYYFCLALLAIPFRNKKYFKKLLDFLSAIDKVLLHKNSPFKWLGWCCLLKFQK